MVGNQGHKFHNVPEKKKMIMNLGMLTLRKRLLQVWKRKLVNHTVLERSMARGLGSGLDLQGPAGIQYCPGPTGWGKRSPQAHAGRFTRSRVSVTRKHKMESLSLGNSSRLCSFQTPLPFEPAGHLTLLPAHSAGRRLVARRDPPCAWTLEMPPADPGRQGTRLEVCSPHSG